VRAANLAKAGEALVDEPNWPPAHTQQAQIAINLIATEQLF